MSKIDDLNDLIENKNGALQSVISVIEALSEPCQKGNCCLESNPPYHWRGCEVNLKPLIENLKFIRETK